MTLPLSVENVCVLLVDIIVNALIKYLKKRAETFLNITCKHILILFYLQ